MNFGKTLQELRGKNNISQENMAETLGVSRQTISNYENSKSYPDILVLIKLCEVYNISLDELIKGNKELLISIKKDKKRTKINISICVSIIVILLLLISYLFYFKNIIYMNKSINNAISFLLKNNDKFITIEKDKKYNKDEMTDNYIKITDAEYKYITTYLNKNNYKYKSVYRFTNFHKESNDIIGYVIPNEILKINYDNSSPYLFWSANFDIVKYNDFTDFFEDNIIGKTPSNNNEIMISNVLANLIINSGIKTTSGEYYPKNYREIINYGDYYYILNNKVKIVGIINYDLAKYDIIKGITWDDINNNPEKYDDIYELYQSEMHNIYNKIYVNEDFISNLENKSINNTWETHVTRIGILIIENQKDKLNKLFKLYNTDPYKINSTYNVLE